MRFWISFFIITACFQISAKAVPLTYFPEALFSSDGKYALIYSFDSLNQSKVDAWTLYLNETNEELSIIIPKGDSVYFVSYVLDRNYFPFFITESGDTLGCKVVNMMDQKTFIDHYQLSVRPLELARKVKYEIDTSWYSVVQPPYTDSIIEYKFLFTFFVDTHRIMIDSVTTNLDSTVYVVDKYEEPFEQMKFYYSPATNYYWMRSAIYAEKLRFKEQQYYTDTVILSEFNREIAHSIHFGKINIGGK